MSSVWNPFDEEGESREWYDNYVKEKMFRREEARGDKVSETTRELAKCQGFDFGIDWDHGWPMLFGTFHYEGSAQGLGYMADTSFLMRFLDVFNVERLQQVNGKRCWVTHNNSKIVKIEPVMPDEGKIFDIEEWREWLKTRDMPSPYEMRTGKKP